MSVAHDFQQDLDDVAAIDVIPQILQMLHELTGMGFSAVARVTPERWIACAVRDEIGFGLAAGGELKVETTICHEIRQSLHPVTIAKVSATPAWARHHTPLQYGFESYISVPILLEDGSMFGTLCAIDPNPADVENGRVLGTTKLFADLIGRHLDIRRRLHMVERRLEEEVETAQLRDQFIAALGHDIKNPIASIAAGARLLRKSVDSHGREVLSLMEQSVARVSNIVDNVLDFARGISDALVQEISVGPLDATLEPIVAEFQQLNPSRRIERFWVENEPAFVDHGRVGQLFSNLLSNALTHGAPQGYVRVGLERQPEGLSLWVANQGEPIPEDALPRLFHPFKRRGDNTHGLGLGLYIASEIAKAHGGTLSVRSDPTETRFTLLVPGAGAAGQEAR